MVGSWQVLQHTGDVGIEVRADSREELFALAARGMFDLLVDVSRVRPVDEDVIEVERESDDLLLRAFLAELLFRLETKGRVYGEFRVSFPGPNRLSVRAMGEALDPDRHGWRTELKAVTYHGLEVRRDGDEWFARVIFDI